MSGMTRITIPVTVTEREVLRSAALRELRDPRDHARFLLREALGLRGNDQSLPMNNGDASVSEASRVAVAS